MKERWENRHGTVSDKRNSTPVLYHPLPTRRSKIACADCLYLNMISNIDTSLPDKKNCVIGAVLIWNRTFRRSCFIVTSILDGRTNRLKRWHFKLTVLNTVMMK